MTVRIYKERFGQGITRVGACQKYIESSDSSLTRYLQIPHNFAVYTTRLEYRGLESVPIHEELAIETECNQL